MSMVLNFLPFVLQDTRFVELMRVQFYSSYFDYLITRIISYTVYNVEPTSRNTRFHVNYHRESYYTVFPLLSFRGFIKSGHRARQLERFKTDEIDF